MTPAMLRWVKELSRYLWLSLAVGVLVAVVALPTFTDPWLSNVGGFIFVVVVVTAVVRGAITLGQAFLQGWREPGRRTR
jgi:uncharacterized membrane protein HdeD (DUF308 family)